jgi:hypothetical protein
MRLRVKMASILSYIGVFAVGELLALTVFMIIRRSIAGEAAFKKPDVETLKGVLERLVLFIGLIADLGTVLVMFGALKLGTRLHDEKDKKISNNYFLVGNLFSVLVAMVDLLICRNLLAQ